MEQNYECFLLERVQNFHQIFKGVCDTEKGRNHWHSKSSKSWLEIFCLPGSFPNEVENRAGFSLPPTCVSLESCCWQRRDLLPQDWQRVLPDGALAWLRARAGGISGECGQKLWLWAGSGEAVIFLTPVSGAEAELNATTASELPWGSQARCPDQQELLPAFQAPSLGKEQEQGSQRSPVWETRHCPVMQREILGEWRRGNGPVKQKDTKGYLEVIVGVRWRWVSLLSRQLKGKWLIVGAVHRVT